jgi:hypothetical protein
MSNTTPAPVRPLRDPRTLGMRLYQEYYENSKGRVFGVDLPLPKWNELVKEVRSLWENLALQQMLPTRRKR